ncbi:patatin-like phospholipase family protein [Chloroflexi bacterium TSY]|nr:patatin-like phospholipase family protein [Chloroflexi bacterium TSY]
MSNNRWQDALPKPIAFVFSGGANLGSIQVGMLSVLRDRGIRPDLVVGTSVGALNGAVVADRGLDTAVDVLESIWHNMRRETIFPGGLVSQAYTLMRSRLYLYENTGLGKLIQSNLTVERIEDLHLPFAAMATELITHQGALFREGLLLPALLASTAIPGVYPPVTINEIQYIDGGIVSNIPLSGALQMGAKSIVVLEVGSVCTPTLPPENIADLLKGAFITSIRQKILAEAPRIAQQVPVLYLPRPCTTDMGMFDYEQGTQLMEETSELVANFLDKSPFPKAGKMCGEPHYHGDADYLNPIAVEVDS